MRGVVLLLVSLVATSAWSAPRTADNAANEPIAVVYPEAYELANVVLALTDYGKADPWQVRKDFPYYQEMRAFFKPVEHHPLLDSVNYSADKWKEYLSFRTDAYAFAFEPNGQLVRTDAFQAFPDVHAFDDHLALVRDFVAKSHFRQFFREHKAFHDSMVTRYRRAYMLDDMRSYLAAQFGDFFSNRRYVVVLSPFVYAQNLHRDLDSLTAADFPTIAGSILDGKPLGREEQSTEIHTLFTEMDHGYVNPVTEAHRALVAASFDEGMWATKSGYEGQDNAVFNEYMTWAVYDLFNRQHFPLIADSINRAWHLQNDSRGFPYGNLFARELERLHRAHPRTPLKDLYPQVLEWTRRVQPTLTKPVIVSPRDSLKVPFARRTRLTVRFSEPMLPASRFDAILQTDDHHKQTIEIGPRTDVRWRADRREVSFDVDLSPYQQDVYLIFNWWGTAHVLESRKGILLKAASYLVLTPG